VPHKLALAMLLSSIRGVNEKARCREATRERFMRAVDKRIMKTVMGLRGRTAYMREQLTKT